MSACVAIPARLASTRLPGKVLAQLAGRTMLEHTHAAAVAADVGPVVVLVDHPAVADHVERFGGVALMTDPALASGTARIASVCGRLPADVVVNLQADAPLTSPWVIVELAERAAAQTADVVLPVARLHDDDDVLDPGVVKVVRAHDDRVLYCSRSPIPHVRDGGGGGWAARHAFWGHIGLYGYRRTFLEAFADLPASPLEDAECLEQLRWLQAGARLECFEVPPQGPSIDTPADLERVRSVLAPVPA